MTVIPRGVAHQNVGHGPNIEITIYARKPLKRLCPTSCGGCAEAHEDQGRQAGRATGTTGFEERA